MAGDRARRARAGVAPTGSGKTLAAFLWALDRLRGEDAARRGRSRVVYVSPLKALAYDIERNLRAPLRGIGAEHVRVGIRTGDTPQRERAAMLRNPPDILVTTPESLYLMLTSRAREMLGAVEAVIVDEIHAVAATKRGSHLALTLERLERQVRSGRAAARSSGSGSARPRTRSRRSAASSSARGARSRSSTPACASSSTCGSRSRWSRWPNPTRAAVGRTRSSRSPGGESEPRGSIWPAIYPELLRLVREHNSTIVFVNNRRSAERVALRLNELAAARTPSEQDAQRERAGGEPAAPRRTRSPAPTTARSRARSARRSRSC